jgi:hypothetical protein
MDSIIAWIIGAALVYALFKLVQWAIAQWGGAQFSSIPGTGSGSARPNRRLERELITLLNGNRREAERLVSYIKRTHPGQSEDWYWDKAIYDLRRDRRA